MKSKISTTFWAIRFALRSTPAPILLYFCVRIVGESLPILLTIQLANILDNITEQISNKVRIQEYIIPIVMWVICLLLSYVIMMLKWRLSERIIPLYSDTHYNTIIFKMHQNVPYKLLTQNEFLKEFNIATDGIHSICGYIASIIQVIALCYNLLLTSFILLHVHWMFCIIIFVSFLIAMVIESKTEKINFEIYQKISESQRICNYYETILINRDNAKEVRLLGLSKYFIGHWKDQIDAISKMEIDASRKIDWKFSAYEFLCEIAAILSLVIGLVMVSKNIITVGSILLIWNNINDTLSNVQGLQRSLNSTSSIASKLEYSRKLYTKYYGDYVHNSSSEPKFDNANESYPISLIDVTFSYRSDIPVIKNVSLQVHEGEIIALCGDNGSGKSTLVKIILGLYLPDNGKVQIRGKNTEDISASMNSYAGVMFQDYIKYPLRLRDNIGLGKVSDINNNDKLLSALRKGDGTNILEKVKSFDSIMSRSMDENGYDLSGGEWQRIALARTYMGDQRIMIFDEPASALDPISEKKQFDTIRKELHGKTGILISHRVGFASMADRIIVLENGTIIESGSHEQLMALHGKYYSLYMSQASWYK